MQTGQEKLGMQTMNQSLATLYMTAADHPGNGHERFVDRRTNCEDMINRGGGVVAGRGTAARRPGDGTEPARSRQ